MTNPTIDEMLEKVRKAIVSASFIDDGTESAKAALEALSEYIEFLPETAEPKAGDSVNARCGDNVYSTAYWMNNLGDWDEIEVTKRNNKPVVLYKEE